MTFPRFCLNKASRIQLTDQQLYDLLYAAWLGCLTDGSTILSDPASLKCQMGKKLSQVGLNRYHLDNIARLVNSASNAEYTFDINSLQRDMDPTILEVALAIKRKIPTSTN